ncbi:hypothetical protein J2X77_002795 [Sphingobacterium sp. 2149]|nr:hypothetical protein [Sphingobacterium sp. 2149]
MNYFFILSCSRKTALTPPAPLRLSTRITTFEEKEIKKMSFKIYTAIQLSLGHLNLWHITAQEAM